MGREKITLPRSTAENTFGVILFEKTVHLLFIYITISRARLDFATIFPRCKIEFYRWPVMLIVILDRFNLVRKSLKRDLVLIVHCIYEGL